VPVQHWELREQTSPSGRQVLVPQTPLLHVPVQHWELREQTSPSGRQVLVPQTPLLQVPAQHWEPAVQPAPLGRHVEPPQAPFVHTPPQHSALDAQPEPCGRHAAPHAPLVQWPVQHWLLAVQRAPCCVQVPTHVPELHTLEQQSRALVQDSPWFLHDGPHTAFSHVRPPQQPPAVQAWFSAAHVVQTWLAHVPLQHSEKAMQASPPGLHIPLPVVACDDVVLWPPPAPVEPEPLLPHPPVRTNKAKASERSTKARDFITDAPQPRAAVREASREAKRHTRDTGVAILPRRSAGQSESSSPSPSGFIRVACSDRARTRIGTQM
jgi:hypothetical protein